MVLFGRKRPGIKGSLLIVTMLATEPPLPPAELI